MSTNTLLRSTAHPPCTEETLEITVPTDRNTLAFTDRLSLRLGLWLLLRSRRPRRMPRPAVTHEDMMRIMETRRALERDAYLRIAFDPQRYLR